MKYKIITLFFLLNLSNATIVNGQSKIDGNLIELSKVALEKSPVLKSNALTVKDAEADSQIQRGIFDYNLFANLSYQKDFYHLFRTDPRNQFLNKVLNSNNLELSSSLQKRLRTGQLIDFSIKYLYNNNNYPFNGFGQQINTYTGDYTGLLNLSITQPLLKGRGKSIITANEKATKIFIEVASENNEFFTSYEILKVGEAYWIYYAAFKSLEIYKSNEERVLSVLDMTEELVKADKKPASDLVQIKADLANQKKLTILAEQNFYNAKLNLGRVIGISDDEANLIGNPNDQFPIIEESGYNELADKEELIKIGLTNRKDLIASLKTTDALELFQKLAENYTKPQLDLTGFGFYGTASQGNGKTFQFDSLSNEEGRYLGAGAKLTFSFPLNNNNAKGNLAKNKIALSNQIIDNENLKRNISLNINSAYNNLEKSALALEQSRQAFLNYQEAFSNEQMKFKTGLTILLNVILFQERLTVSELDFIKAQQNYALAIINLRHETGTLINRNPNGFLVNKENYYNIPKK